MRRWWVAAALVALPGSAGAQALSCRVPDTMAAPRPDVPSASQPARRVAIGSYTLALTWSPQYCRDHGGERDAQFQCGSGQRFGFVLHGLWPDGEGKVWPQYCRATGILPQPVLRHHLCATPSAQLLQHEWAKHGTCMPGYSPERYFDQSNAMYRRLRFPDMAALARTPLTAGALATAIARANPTLRPEMMRITTTRQGWLDEIWLCLDRRFRYTRCPAHQGGVQPGTRLRIWTG